MLYTLMHRQIAVAEINIDEDNATISEIGEVFEPTHIPIGIAVRNDRPDKNSLIEWWNGRAIPASRSGLRDALEILNVSYPKKLLTKCWGLSLSDQYWVNPVDNPMDWSKINFFQNTFSEDVGDALFGKAPDNEAISLISPDNTSDGWLRKKWKIIDGKRCLIKGGSNPAQQEPLNEALAAAILRRLNIPHVPYMVIWEDDLPYSVCEDFITPDTDLVSAWHIKETRKKENDVSPYRHFLDSCEDLGIRNARKSLDEMLVLDYLIANEDRHYNNFGAVRNAVTLEWQGLAPIFDCGTSMWYNQFTAAIRPKGKTPSKPFRSSHDEQIKLVGDFSWLDLSALNGVTDEFYDILSCSHIIDEQRRTALCKALDSRIASLQEHIQNQSNQYFIPDIEPSDYESDEDLER